MKTRHILLLTALLSLLTLSASAMSDAEWEQLKREAVNRPRNVIYDNDGDDVNYHHGLPTIETILAKRTTWLNKYPVNTVIYCVGTAFQVKFPTDNGELFDVQWPSDSAGPDGKGDNVNASLWLNAIGTDILKLQLDYARKNNIELFAEFRFNDTHDACDTPENPCPYFPHDKRLHPEYLMGSYEHQPPYATWTSYDFTHPEIRDRFVALVLEVARKYEIDGLFIDLYRWLGIFKSVAWGGVASEEETAALSDMFRRIRTETEAIGRKRGRPILFAIRVPDSAGYCKAIGFDWEGLMSEGVFDMVMPAGNNHFTPWGESIELCHKYGVKCYPSIDMPSFNRHPVIRARLSLDSYHARVSAAYQAGADGIFYYNLFDEWAVKNIMVPDPAMLRQADKRYYISPIVLWNVNNNLASGAEYNKLPELLYGIYSTLMPGKKLDFRMEIGDDLAALKAEGVPFRINAELVADGQPGLVELSTNGVVWKYLGSHKDRHSFTVDDAKALKAGVNDITFTSLAKPGEKIQKELLSGAYLLQGDRQPPWRRIFPTPADNSDNESIVDGAYRIRDTGNGSPCLVYPLSADIAKDIELSFETKVEMSDDPLGAMMRLVGGGKAEIVTFQPTKVGFHFAGVSADFDTTHFHQYHVRMANGSICLEADGKQLLEAQLTMEANVPASKLKGMSYVIPEMDKSCMIIGSLADKGKGISHWRNIRQFASAGSVRLQDFAVEIKFGEMPRQRPMTSWEHEATGATTLSAGNHAYYADPVVGEWEVRCSEDSSAKLCLSSGGMFTEVEIDGRALVLPGRAVLLPANSGNGVNRIRIELDNLNAKVFVDGEYLGDIPGRNVSMALRDEPARAAFNEASNGVFRNSGIIAVPQGDIDIRALRVQVFPK